MLQRSTPPHQDDDSPNVTLDTLDEMNTLDEIEILACDIQPVDNVGDFSEDAVEELFPDLNVDNNDIMDISLDYEPDDEPDSTTTTFRPRSAKDTRINFRESHSDLSESASEWVKSGSSSDDEQ